MSHAFYYELENVKAQQEHGGIWYYQIPQVSLLEASKATKVLHIQNHYDGTTWRNHKQKVVSFCVEV